MQDCVALIRRHKGLGLLALLAIAFWPVWRWYAARMTDLSDEPWGLLALGAATVFLVARRRRFRGVRPSLPLAPAVLALAYAAGYPFLPPILRAALAVSAIGCAASGYCLGRSFHPGLWGLVVLSLPVVPSLQFVLGYPMRTFAAAMAAGTVRLTGFAAAREGTCIEWGGRLIMVDAPCSGVKMLWAGLFLAAASSCFLGFGLRRTALTAGIAVLLVVLGNAARAAALFYLEAGAFHSPAWVHGGVGIVVFLFAAGAIIVSAEAIRRRSGCAGLASI